MMRRILLLTLLLFAIINNSWGQIGEYKVEFRMESINLFASYSGNCGSYVNARLRFTDGNEMHFFRQPVGDGEDLPRLWTVNFSATKTLKDFWMDVAAMKWHGGFTSKCKKDNSYTGPASISYGYTECLSSQKFCDHFGFTGYRSVLPLLTIVSPGLSNRLPTDDKIVIKSHEGFKSNEYNWQYATQKSLIWNSSLSKWENSYNWTSLPQYNGLSSISLSARDLLGANVFDHINENIYFRQVAYSEHSISEIVTYNVALSAPHITETTYTSPVCHGENNGKLHIKFDRALSDNERLYFAPKNKDTGDYEAEGDSIFIDQTTKTATINGFSAGFYDFRLYGTYRYGINSTDTINTYTDGLHHCDTITIAERPKVVFTVQQDSVHCYAGSDGIINVAATGGIGKYRVALFDVTNTTDSIQPHFFTNTTQFTNLKRGDYKVYLKDIYNCEPQHPDSNYQRISVLEPAAPVRTHNTSYQEPKAFGYSDGIIWSFISGGTGAYDVTWRDSLGNVVSNETLIRPNTSSTIKTVVNGIKKGTYYLYVKDQNRDAASPSILDNYCGCEALDSIFVNEPPKLLVSIDTLHYVTCNGDTDGQLVANAKGGRPRLDGSLPYDYQWQRMTADSTSVLETYTVNDSILTTLPSAHYVVCITDTNHIKAYSRLFYLTQPDPLVVTTNVIRNLSCSGEMNGEMEVIVTGGTKPYSYFWETGDTTRVISGLSKGIYSVFVRDARYIDNQKDSGWYTHYCQEETSGEIISPNGISITPSLGHPTCSSYSDGSISLSVSGGVSPYTYRWDDGVTTLNRTNLSDGLYTITITDASACNFSEDYLLEEPEPLVVNIGNDFTLCKDQSLKIDGGVGLPNINYLWTDVSNSTLSVDSVYTINKAGQYRLLATNQVGCTASDQINVGQSNTELVTDFVVASKIPNNTKVNAINIIKTGFDDVEWIMPDEAIVWEDTQDKVQFSISQNGHYTIGMIANKDNCQDILYKTLEVVNKGDIDWTEDETSEPFLKYFIVYPNPNDGNFKAKIELREKTNYSLYLFDTNGNLLETKVINNSTGEETVFSQTSLSIGTYYLRFVSSKTTSVFKIIINK